MRRRRLATSKGIPSARGPIMLGLGLLLLVSGCGTTGRAAFAPTSSDPAPKRRPEPPPPTPSRVESPAEPEPTDPGADALLRSIRYALGPAVGQSSAELRVGLEGLRNQSHASAAEFTGLRLRLADLLTRSGLAAGQRPIRFVAARDAALDFELNGTCYLVGPAGDDEWELFLSLRPVGRSWGIWQPEGPVRMPRRPSPGEPHIIFR